MRIIASSALLFSLAVAALAQPPLPRKSPEFTIEQPSGQKTLLSSFKGKVVVLEFLYTTCIHCQHESEQLTKLYREFGPKGVQMLGVGFNDNAPVLVNGFVQQFGVGYPVGFSNPDAVLAFLGFSLMDRYVVPQVVVIDRKGMIRAQSGPQGDPNLQDEGYMRNLLTKVLSEPAATSVQKPAVKTTASNHQ
ncbi:MAG TPA: TlpA disulfide reductase family protein [Bryobacteraceae bacterium]|nr:TlpA disulfide reductase family protein [Bryobacteraceae bacterium]